MAGACMVSIALTDVVFAFDSAVSVVAISKTTFIVVSSNVLATIALRGWISMVGTLEHTGRPRFAIAALLGAIAFKLMAGHRVHVPHAFALSAIVALIAAAIAESLHGMRRAGAPPP
jgi:tellurite resistance protein TerC